MSIVKVKYLDKVNSIKSIQFIELKTMKYKNLT